MSQSATLAEDIEQLDVALKQLKVAYEKYFAGIERVEPLKEREELKKELRRLMSVNNNNTAQRFRLQSLQASFITHESYWNRIARQIEEGTYKRDRLRAEKILQQSAGGEQRAEATQPAAPAPAPKSYPEPLRRLHQAFVTTRQQLGIRDPVPIEIFVATVQKQYVALKERYKTPHIEFKVAVKDGKAILKAVPKSSS